VQDERARDEVLGTTGGDVIWVVIFEEEHAIE